MYRCSIWSARCGDYERFPALQLPTTYDMAADLKAQSAYQAQQLSQLPFSSLSASPQYGLAISENPQASRSDCSSWRITVARMTVEDALVWDKHRAGGVYVGIIHGPFYSCINFNVYEVMS